MRSLSDVSTEELEERARSLVSQMSELAGQFGPLLTKYGHMRQETAAIVDELESRGVYKKDG